MLSYNPLYGSEILLDNDFRRISWEEKFNLYKYPYPNLWQVFMLNISKHLLNFINYIYLYH